MARVAAIAADQSYTFSDYFNLNADIEDILGYFGYRVRSQILPLPQSDRPLSRLSDLAQRLSESLTHIGLTSEAARREFLIVLDRWSPTDNAEFYGAVTMGNIWQFGKLQREEQKIIQGLNLYRVPEDLELLMRNLIGILEANV